MSIRTTLDTSTSRRAFAATGIAAVGATVAFGASAGVFAGRKLLRGGPPPVWLRLSDGIHYERRLLSVPSRTVVHVVASDLRNPAIELVVTPIDAVSELPFRARTTQEFLEQHHLIAAVNGDYFAPWRCNNPVDYAPKRGDLVAVMGLTAHRGQVFVPREKGYFSRRFKDCTWYFTSDNRASTQTPSDPVYSAISGGPVLVRSGLPAGLFADKRNPQTALAIDKSGEKLWLVVVDGRQPDYSEGLTDGELTDLLIQLGAWNALRLDGGGSSTMAVQDARGRSRVVNSPIHAGIPGWQRPVANHFGIRVRT